MPARTDKQRIDALEAALSRRTEQPRWVASLGGALCALGHVILLLQQNVWLVFDDKADRFIGGIVNAVVGFLVGYFALEWPLAPLVAYEVWFIAAAVAFQQSEDFAGSAAAFNAKLLLAFDVEVDGLELEDDANDTLGTLYLLIGLLPALVMGFLFQWVLHPRYDMECTTKWSNDDTFKGCVKFGDVCCQAVDEKFDYFTFMAYLTGNVLAGYGVVKFCAKCLVAKATKDGAIITPAAVDVLN
jgi:hypothetical protein